MKPNELNEIDSGHRLDKSVSNMRNGLIMLIIVLGAVPATAEQADSRALLPQAVLPPPQKLIIRSENVFPLTLPARFGMFTLAPPEANGEVIRVSIPIGELASRAARAISDARHRRAERKVDERIARELLQLAGGDDVRAKPQK